MSAIPFGRDEIEWLRSAIVRIDAGTTRGSGFFVLPGVVVTCRHVIGSLAPDLVRVKLNNQREVEVIECDFSPVSAATDVCFLSVKWTDHPVLPLGPYATAPADVYCFSYQYTDRGYDGYSILGQLIGPAHESKEPNERDLLVIQRAVVDQGASGSPVFSIADRLVVGMIKRRRDQDGAYAIPIELLEACRSGILTANQKATQAYRIGSGKLRGYLSQVREEHSYITLMDLSRQLRLRDIFVSLSIAPTSFTGLPMKLGASGSLERPELIEAETEAVRRDLGAPSRRYSQRSVHMYELLREQRVIILGEPGSGKTTLLRHFVAIATEQGKPDQRIPVFIRLAHLESRQDSISKFVERAYAEHAEVIASAFKSGATSLFLDGLDEVSRAQSELIRAEIDRFAALGNQVFLTCRTVSYPQGLFSSAFRLFECLGFNSDQQERFLTLWFVGETRHVAALQRQLRSSPQFRGFSRNPLLLALLAVVAEGEANFSLPRRRSDLYNKALTALFNRRASNSDRMPPDRLKLLLLESLAYYMFVKNSGMIEEDELFEYAESRVGKASGSAVSNRYSTDDIVDTIVNVDGILIRIGQKHFAFLHLTFQEYLTAKHLLRTGSWKELPSRKLQEPRWEEVVRLLGSMLPEEDVGHLYSLLRHLDYPRDHLLSRSLICMLGRWSSDIPTLGILALQEIAGDLFHLLVEASAAIHVPEAISALASLCSSHMGVFEQCDEFFRKLWLDTGSNALGLRYIAFLSQVDVPASGDRLQDLLRSLCGDQSRVLDEFETRILTAVLAGLWRTDDPGTIEKMLLLLKEESSIVAAAAALALAESNFGLDLLSLNRSSPRHSRADELEYFLLARRASPDSLLELFLSGSCHLRCFATICQNFDSEACLPESLEVGKLLSWRTKPEEYASAIAVWPLTSLATAMSELRGMALDSTLPMLARCSTVDMLIRTDSSVASSLLSGWLEDKDWVHLARTCLATLREIRSDSLHRFLVDNAGVFSGSTIPSVMRLLSSSPSKSASEIVGKLKVTADGPMLRRKLAFMGLSQDPRLYSVCDEILRQDTSIEFENRAAVYRALSWAGTVEAARIVLKAIGNEIDVMVIAYAIEALGECGGQEAEHALLQYLYPGNWPILWPRPLEPIRQGDQRPSDRRQLAVILGLNRLLVEASLADLQAIANDRSEDIEIREAAATAATTIFSHASSPSISGKS